MSAIPRGEVERYLGYRDGARPDAATQELISRCSDEIIQVMQPRSCWSVYRIESAEASGVRLGNAGGFTLAGADIRRHLEGCERCVLMAATLGSEVDRLIAAAQVRGMARALVLDCCATAAIEEVCDAVQREIEEWAAGEGRGVTPRYSPGYGDLPITCQREWTRLLDTFRRIGMVATADHILIPRKSVTAALGLYRGPRRAKHEKTCEGCTLYTTCPFRKEGKRCDESDG